MKGAAAQATGGANRDRGAVLPIVALLLPVLLVMTAFAVDLGRQRASRRTMQARADIVALDLVRLADGRTEAAILASSADPTFLASFTGSATRNEVDPSKLAAVYGTWSKLSGFIPCRVNENAPPSTACIPTAVKVTAHETTDYLFAPGSGDATREAIATRGDKQGAYFQVGSFLLSVNPATDSIVGQLLQQAVPGASALSYTGLAGANVTLGGLQAGLSAISPDKGLDSEISYRELALAAVKALEAEGGSTSQISALNSFIAVAPQAPAVKLADLVEATADGGTPGASAKYSVIGLLTGAAMISDSEHAISLPGNVIGIPGVTSVDIDLTIIERPQIGGPDLYDSASTGQYTMTVTPNISLSTVPSGQNACNLNSPGRALLSNLLGGLVNFTLCLLGPVNQLVSLTATVDAPITLEAAASTVTLTRIDCGTNRGIQLTPASSAVALLSDFNVNVTGTVAGQSLGNVATIKVPAHAGAAGSTAAQYFNHPSQFGPPPRSTASSPLGFANLLAANGSQATILNANLTPILSPVVTPLLSTLNNTLGQLDSLVVGPLADMLGLNLGGADLTALSLHCESAAPTLVG